MNKYARKLTFQAYNQKTFVELLLDLELAHCKKEIGELSELDKTVLDRRFTTKIKTKKNQITLCLSEVLLNSTHEILFSYGSRAQERLSSHDVHIWQLSHNIMHNHVISEKTDSHLEVCEETLYALVDVLFVKTLARKHRKDLH